MKQNLSKSVTNFFNSLNTHTVAGVGVGTGLLSIGAILAQNTLDKTLPAHGFQMLVPFIDFYAQSLAAPILATSLGAAYFGRPHNVPSGN